jgi:Flp pilus assembly protein TadG
MKMIFKYLRYHKGQKGIALVWMALMLTVLFMLAGLGIDIGYMYYVRNQLQTAADASALAGAALITNPNDLMQTNVRIEAITFAGKNTAAGGDAVVVVTDNTNALGANNDITVGRWDGTTYTPNTLPVNAIQVRPQRVAGLLGSRGPVRVFLGQIFRMTGGDWSFMSARAEAIAAKLPRASSFVAMGSTVCTAVGGCTYPVTCQLTGATYAGACVAAGNPYSCCTGPGTGATCTAKLFFPQPTSAPNDQKFAWTSLLQQPGSASLFSALMCGNSPFVDVCSVPGIYGISGTAVSTLRDFESIMFDPNFDGSNKDKNTSGDVIGWWVMIPQNSIADPMFGPDPHPVIGYVLVHIIAVCAPGTTGCKGYDSPPGLCSTLGLTGSGGLAIDIISCISCGSVTPGLKAVLVR